MRQLEEGKKKLLPLRQKKKIPIVDKITVRTDFFENINDMDISLGRLVKQEVRTN